MMDKVLNVQQYNTLRPAQAISVQEGQLLIHTLPGGGHLTSKLWSIQGFIHQTTHAYGQHKNSTQGSILYGSMEGRVGTNS